MQGDALPQAGKADEDCLYLNVYSPRSASAEDAAGYPVRATAACEGGRRAAPDLHRRVGHATDACSPPPRGACHG